MNSKYRDALRIFCVCNVVYTFTDYETCSFVSFAFSKQEAFMCGQTKGLFPYSFFSYRVTLLTVESYLTCSSHVPFFLAKIMQQLSFSTCCRRMLYKITAVDAFLTHRLAGKVSEHENGTNPFISYLNNLRVYSFFEFILE